MAVSSLLTLLDDIATVLDDVAVMTKVATKKTAGVLGDDLALNAEQVSGVKPNRELPVVWAVFKGSARNKLILVPAALATSAFIPWLITPLLMIGGAYLCYEGTEKVLHKFFHSKEEDDSYHQEIISAISNPAVDMVEFEKNKIKGAIRTDFVLSAEIIVIALGVVAEKSFTIQASVVVTIAVLMTLGVYGLVAGIVKLDDAGLHLSKTELTNAWTGFKQRFGKAILWFAPYLMKGLSIVGTAAMFIVGGEILVHGFAEWSVWFHHLEEAVKNLKIFGLFTLFSIVVGFIAGCVILAVVTGVGKLRPTSKELT